MKSFFVVLFTFCIFNCLKAQMPSVPLGATEGAVKVRGILFIDSLVYFPILNRLPDPISGGALRPLREGAIVFLKETPEAIVTPYFYANGSWTEWKGSGGASFMDIGLVGPILQSNATGDTMFTRLSALDSMSRKALSISGGSSSGLTYDNLTGQFTYSPSLDATSLRDPDSTLHFLTPYDKNVLNGQVSLKLNVSDSGVKYFSFYQGTLIGQNKVNIADSTNKYYSFYQGSLLATLKMNISDSAVKYITPNQLNIYSASIRDSLRRKLDTSKINPLRVGITTPYNSQSAIFFGTSITNTGYYVNIVAGTMGVTTINNGIPGSALHDFYQRYVEIPYVLPGDTTYKYIFFEYGVNDITYGASDVAINVARAIDTTLAHGFTAKQIVWVSPSYVGQYTHLSVQQDIADSVIAVAKRKGVQWTNTYYYMRDNGGSNLLQADSIHPTAAGGIIQANSILSYLEGGGEFSNPVVFDRGIIVGGPTTYRNSVTFNYPIYLRELRTARNAFETGTGSIGYGFGIYNTVSNSQQLEAYFGGVKRIQLTPETSVRSYILGNFSVGNTTNNSFNFNLTGSQSISTTLAIGAQTSVPSGFQLEIQKVGSGGSGAFARLIGFAANTTVGSTLRLAKSHNAAISTFTTTVNGEGFGQLNFAGYNSANTETDGAIIRATQDSVATTFLSTALQFLTSNSGVAAAERMRITGSGKIGIGTISPTAQFHIMAGTAIANSSPLKLTRTSAVLLTTPEDGAIEVDASHIYHTIGSVRYQLDQQQTTDTASYTATAGQTAFTFSSLPSSYKDFQIIKNGVVLEPIIAYTKVGNVITLISAAAINDRVRYWRIK